MLGDLAVLAQQMTRSARRVRASLVGAFAALAMLAGPALLAQAADTIVDLGTLPGGKAIARRTPTITPPMWARLSTIPIENPMKMLIRISIPICPARRRLWDATRNAMFRWRMIRPSRAFMRASFWKSRATPSMTKALPTGRLSTVSLFATVSSSPATRSSAAAHDYGMSRD